MCRMFIEAITHRESGHGETVISPIIAGVGAVLLGIGAASDDMGWLAVTGGIVLAVGLIALRLITHGTIEKGIYGRVDELEAKK